MEEGKGKTASSTRRFGKARTCARRRARHGEPGEDQSEGRRRPHGAEERTGCIREGASDAK